MLNIIGDGEHARVVADADAARSIRCDVEPEGSIVAIGDIQARRRVVTEMADTKWWPVIHPATYCGSDVRVEGGSFVGAVAMLQRGVRIGSHVIVGTGAIVEHDVEVGDFCNIGPGVVIGGGAIIGQRTQLGLGCRIRDHVKIGSCVTVGMGSVVVNDVPDGATVMGVPAK